MKLHTNFVVPAQRAVRPLLVLGWTAVVALAALAAWLVGDGFVLRAELPQLQQRAQRSATAAQAEAQGALPAEAEMVRTRDRVAKVNAAARSGGLPSAVLLGELETLLPPQAWLTRLHYRAAEGDLRLVAAARNAELLSTFLLRLERSALFEQAMLVREVQPAAAGGSDVQFEIRLKVRS